MFKYLILSSADTIISLMFKIRKLRYREIKDLIRKRREWAVVQPGTHIPPTLCSGYLRTKMSGSPDLQEFLIWLPRTAIYFSTYILH